MRELIGGKTLKQLKRALPLLDDVMNMQEIYWENPHYSSCEKAMEGVELSIKDILDGSERLKRFAPYLEKVFPETSGNKGIIESDLVEIPRMKAELENLNKDKLDGTLYLKCDHNLSISGSIKARGGIYEVLKHAEDLAIRNNLLTINDDYSMIATKRFQDFYSSYAIAVGSTGNLGLSIGLIGAKLGFKVFVHMSSDAMTWKKALLRERGVTVIEYDSDYSQAVKAGRKEAELDDKMYFIDDENSKDLFLGYSVAALRLKEQLLEKNIVINGENRMCVYLPCGVGGAPGGITFGLKTVFGDNVDCYFVEPTHSPSMLLGMMTGLYNTISVYDFGIDNRTCADGLAVGRCSAFVGQAMRELVAGVFTVSDTSLYRLLAAMVDQENIRLEPSALAGVFAVGNSFQAKSARNTIDSKVHIAWATGGSMVPDGLMNKYYEIGINSK